MILKAVIIWMVLLPLAIANAAFRNLVVTPRIGEHGGHIVSTVLLCLVIFGVSWLSITWIHPHSRAEAIGVGLLWLLLTMSFEFLAGHYVFGNSWDKLLADYNVLRGRIWIMVLAAMFFAPWWAAFVRG